MARIILFAADLSETIARTELRPEIRWGKPEDHCGLIAAGASPEWAEWITGADSSARFAVAEEDGRIIGQNIYVTGETVQPYRWLVINLRNGRDVVAMGGFVAPERRGRHLLPDIKGFAARDFAQRGYCRMISWVDSRNAPSIRSHTRVGAVPLATLTRIRIGRLALLWKGWSLPQVRWGSRPFVITA